MRGARAELRVFGLKKKKKRSEEITDNRWVGSIALPKFRAKEKQLPWSDGCHNAQPSPWHGAHGCHCHTSLPTSPGWGQAALASLERNREIHHKTPCEVAGKASPGAGLRQGCGLCHHVLVRSCVPTSCGAVAEMLPGGGRAGGSSLGWTCGGTVPALNVNVGSSAEQTTCGCPVLQGRGGGGALAH